MLITTLYSVLTIPFMKNSKGRPSRGTRNGALAGLVAAIIPCVVIFYLLGGKPLSGFSLSVPVGLISLMVIVLVFAALGAQLVTCATGKKVYALGAVTGVLVGLLITVEVSAPLSIERTSPLSLAFTENLPW